MANKRNLPQELFNILNPILPFFALMQDYKRDETAIRIAFDGMLYGFIVDKLNIPQDNQQGRALIKTAINDVLELAFESKLDKDQAKKVFAYYKEQRKVLGQNFFDQMMIQNTKKQKEFEENVRIPGDNDNSK